MSLYNARKAKHFLYRHSSTVTFFRSHVAVVNVMVTHQYDMAKVKNKSLFSLLKKFFFADHDTNPNQDIKKRRKWLLGRCMIIRLPSNSTETPLALKDKQVAEAEEACTSHAMAIDEHHCAKTEQSAAIKIQSAFRGYLARKALLALKGIVRLQAIIRGQAVRRQTMTTLKSLQTLVNIHESKIFARRNMSDTTCSYDVNRFSQTMKEKINIKMDTNTTQRRWNDSTLTKEEIDALFMNKKEAFIKRGRIREYSFNHRNSAESERQVVRGRWRYWLDQWVDTQLSKSKELEDLDSILISNPNPRVQYRGKPVGVTNHQRKYNHNKGLKSPLHKKQCPLSENEEEYSAAGSSITPTYMAATQSASAKSRSNGLKKLRPGNVDTYSDGYSPCKNRLEAPKTGRNINGKKQRAYEQTSPSLKSVSGSVKFCRTLKDVSFDSECSLPNWDRNAFR